MGEAIFPRVEANPRLSGAECGKLRRGWTLDRSGQGDIARREVRRIDEHRVPEAVARLNGVDPVGVQATDVLETGVVQYVEDDPLRLVPGAVHHPVLIAPRGAAPVKGNEDHTELNEVPRVQQSLV